MSTDMLLDGLSEEEVEYLIAEKKADLQRAEIDLNLAQTQIGGMSVREKKARLANEDAKKVYDEIAAKVESLKSSLDADKAEAISLEDSISTCNEEQVDAEENLRAEIRKLGITDAEFDSLDSDVEKAVMECNRVDAEVSKATAAADAAKKDFNSKSAAIKDASRTAKIDELKQGILLGTKKKAKLLEDVTDHQIYLLESKYAKATDDLEKKSLELEIVSLTIGKKLGKVTPVSTGDAVCLMAKDGAFYSYSLGTDGNIVFTALDRAAVERPTEVLSNPDAATIKMKTQGKRAGFDYEIISKPSEYSNVSYTVDAASIGTAEAIEKYFDKTEVNVSYAGHVLDRKTDSANGVDEFGYTDSLGNFIPVYVADGISAKGTVSAINISGVDYDVLAADANVSELTGTEVEQSDLVLYNDVAVKTYGINDIAEALEDLKAKGCKEGTDYIVNDDGAGTYTVSVADIKYDYKPSDINFTVEGVKAKVDTKIGASLADSYDQIAKLGVELIEASTAAEKASVELATAETMLNTVKTESTSVAAVKDALLKKKASISGLMSAYEEGKKKRFAKMTEDDDKLTVVKERIVKNETEYASKEAEYKDAEAKYNETKAALDMAEAKRVEKEESIKKITEETIPTIKDELSDICKAIGKTLEDVIGPEKPAAPEPAPEPAPAPAPAPAPKAEEKPAEPAPAPAPAPKAEEKPAEPAPAPAPKAEAKAAASVPVPDAPEVAADEAVAALIDARAKAKSGDSVVVQQTPGDSVAVTESYGANGVENFIIIPTEGAANDMVTVNSGTRFKLDFENPNIVNEDGVPSTWNRTKHAKIDNGGYISLKADKAISSYKVTIEGTKGGKPYSLVMKVMNLCFAVTLQSMKLDSFMSSVKMSLLEINTYSVTEISSGQWFIDGTQLIPGKWVAAGKGDKPLVHAMLSPDNRTVEVKRVEGTKGSIKIVSLVNGAEYHTPLQISDK